MRLVKVGRGAVAAGCREHQRIRLTIALPSQDLARRLGQRPDAKPCLGVLEPRCPARDVELLRAKPQHLAAAPTRQ